jgi:signal recognition particle receptor subunit alpha
LNSAEQWGKCQSLIPKQMRTFEESLKSKKTVASMIERKNDEKENKKTGELIYQLILGLFVIYRSIFI